MYCPRFFRTGVLLLLLALSFQALGQEQGGARQGPFVFQGVSVHGQNLSFGLADRIWLKSLDGGQAQAVTEHGHDRYPLFSPDGTRLAFCRLDSGGGDVFVLDLKSRKTRRLTWHPSLDRALAWSPDGRKLMFISYREGTPARLFEFDLDGVYPQPLPFPSGFEGCYGPQGKRLAYVPISMNRDFGEFRYYRGGRTSQIHIAASATGKIKALTPAGSNAYSPMWVGDTLYYLSDENGISNLYRRPIDGGAARRLTSFSSFGIRAAAASKQHVALIRDGFLYTYGLETNKLEKVDLQVPLDFSRRNKRMLNVQRWISATDLAAGGERLCVDARGDLFRVDSATGKSANLTQTSGVAERSGSFSPDGKWLAYFSDESGGYQLHIKSLGGKSGHRKIPIEGSFYQELSWSPDSTRLSFSDHRLGLWSYALSDTSVTLITRSSDPGQNAYSAGWSPNSRYLAYEKRGDNHLPGIYIHDFQEGKSHGVSDRDVYATSPIFDASGQFLYFVSSPNGAGSDFKWGVLNGIMDQPHAIRHLNAVVLSKQGVAPMTYPALPNLDVKWQGVTTQIDFAEISKRIVPLELPATDIFKLYPGPPAVIYLAAREWPTSPGLGQPPKQVVFRLNLRNPGQLEKVVPALVRARTNRSSISHAHFSDRMAYETQNGWRLLTYADGKAQTRSISIGALAARVDREQEWRQIYREAWAIMDEHLYDPNFHGQDLDHLKKHFARYLPNIGNRSQLNQLLSRALGHISVSHLAIGGGHIQNGQAYRETIGLLGADFQLEGNHYRFSRVLRSAHYDERGENLHAPLDQIGARVEEGDYLLAVDGIKVDGSRNIYSYFVDKAERMVRIRVAASPDGQGARTLKVFSLQAEQPLRRANWANRRREMVAQLSDGKLGYLYIGGYHRKGLEDFMRGYYASRSKQGLIIDQRFNGGGITPDALIELLKRKPAYAYMFRNGTDLPTPVNAMAGPKLLITNQWNASAAETMALMFRLGKVGTIVGKPTFGAGIGPYGYSISTIDGGRIQVPNRGAYDPAGNWGIENTGVKPHLDVAFSVEDWRAGRDSQLEAAVREALAQARKGKAKEFKHPDYPVHPFEKEKQDAVPARQSGG